MRSATATIQIPAASTTAISTASEPQSLASWMSVLNSRLTASHTASMPVFIVEERNSGLRSYVGVNEGLGKALRFGANGPEVLERLRWMRDGLIPC